MAPQKAFSQSIGKHSKRNNHSMLSLKMRLFAWLFLWLFRLHMWRKQEPLSVPKPQQIKKILLCNQGSLGDGFLTTSLIPLLRHLFPGCEIGVLIDTGALSVFEQEGLVNKIHHYRHWLSKNISWLQKLKNLLYFLRYEQTNLVQELKDAAYDCSINCYPFSADSLLLCTQAHIPFRLSFSVGGYQTLACATIAWREGTYLQELYLDIGKALGATPNDLSHAVSPWIHSKQPAAPKKIPYLLFHIFSSETSKDLPLDFWRELTRECASLPFPIIFTGYGDAQYRLISDLMIEGQTHNLCNQLSFGEFVETIKEALYLVSVDTVAIHIRAACQRHWIGLYQKTPLIDLWAPPSTPDHDSYCFITYDRAIYERTHRSDHNFKWVDTVSPKEVALIMKQTLAQTIETP